MWSRIMRGISIKLASRGTVSRFQTAGGPHLQGSSLLVSSLLDPFGLGLALSLPSFSTVANTLQYNFNRYIHYLLRPFCVETLDFVCFVALRHGDNLEISRSCLFGRAHGFEVRLTQTNLQGRQGRTVRLVRRTYRTSTALVLMHAR